jgi:hypothetical protein
MSINVLFRDLIVPLLLVDVMHHVIMKSIPFYSFTVITNTNSHISSATQINAEIIGGKTLSLLPIRVIHDNLAIHLAKCTT